MITKHTEKIKHRQENQNLTFWNVVLNFIGEDGIIGQLMEKQPSYKSYEEDTEMSNVSAKTSAAPDYSKKECWYQIPEITKDVDTGLHHVQL